MSYGNAKTVWVTARVNVDLTSKPTVHSSLKDAQDHANDDALQGFDACVYEAHLVESFVRVVEVRRCKNDAV